VDRPSDEQISRWYPRLFRTALRLTGSAEDAADLTQQTFLLALDRWGQFDGRSLPTTWLHSVLINCVRDWTRRRAVRGTVQIDEWSLLAIADGAHEGRAAMETRESLAALRQAIADLPDAVRHALVITVIDGYSYVEAARMLNEPVGTIASRVHDARGRLRSALQAAEGGVQ
jgi:RNA polymerase sigma-70 factor, ECF subfamily